jgi:hypothetical protein
MIFFKILFGKKILHTKSEGRYECMLKEEKERQKIKKEVDVYFELGDKAQNFWEAGAYKKAMASGEKQLDWYRDNGNRAKLEKDLMGVLPKQILGLDIVLRALKKDEEFSEAIFLVEEFGKITDKDSLYNSEMVAQLQKKFVTANSK